MGPGPAPLVVLDWGTTSLRGARIAGSAGSAVVEERAFAEGILAVPPGGFEALFEARFGDWLADGTRCLIAGMAGSRQGWREAPYVATPAGASDLASRLAWVRPGRVAIVPGVSTERGGVPDVMRGEETQVFGALDLLGLDGGTFVLPGTHSKWVRVEGRRIVSFTTAMTGEFYALLRRHSLLARTLPEVEAPWQPEAFDAGVDRALAAPSLLQTAFSVRTLALFERQDAAALESQLSGLVIGEELRAMHDPAIREVVLIGSDALTARYARALARLGVATRAVGAEATWRGLANIAATPEFRDA